jgi:hypothetical protein
LSSAGEYYFAMSGTAPSLPDCGEPIADATVEKAARALWTELERLDPDPAGADSWDELDALTRDLYMRAMRRSLRELTSESAYNNRISG